MCVCVISLYSVDDVDKQNFQGLRQQAINFKLYKNNPNLRENRVYNYLFKRNYFTNYLFYHFFRFVSKKMSTKLNIFSYLIWFTRRFSTVSQKKGSRPLLLYKICFQSTPYYSLQLRSTNLYDVIYDRMFRRRRQKGKSLR